MTSHDAAGAPGEPPLLPGGEAALIAALRAQVALLLAQNAQLLARVAELERRLGLDSSNSGKPPSSDGLKKPSRTESLRERSGKKPGGQAGHPGKTLCQVSTPDATINHFPAVCRGCGLALPEAGEGHTARQVFDLPEPRPLVVTEHRAHRCRCAACGTATEAAFPEGVTAPVQYGPRLAASVVYLANAQFVPEDRLARLLADLFAVSLSRATIGQMSRRAAVRLEDFTKAVGARLAAAPVKHMDETGFRVGGRTQWLHIAATTGLSYYRVSPKRGSLMEGVSGIVVHDHWAPYYTMTGVEHALCNAHHLRELQALATIEREDWARRMQRLLRRACHAATLARAREQPLRALLIARIRQCYDAITARGLALHEAQAPLTPEHRRPRRGPSARRIGHNLLLRLTRRKDDVLRFLTRADVPFTNNPAEQDGRMMKLRQKISGGFRSAAGADDFAILRTLIGTARKQGWDIIQRLTQPAHTLIVDLDHA